MRGFGLERSWRTGGTGNTQYNTSGTFVVPFGKQFTQISGAGVPGTPASYYAGTPAVYYAGAPAAYYAGVPSSYVAPTPGFYSPPSYYIGYTTYNFVTAYYTEPSGYSVYATGSQGSCPNANYYYITPGAYTSWTCTPVYEGASYNPGSYVPYSPGSYYAGIPAAYYPGAPASYTPAGPASYYAGATGPNNTILGVTFPGGTAGNPGAYVNPTTIDTNYTYVYPNSYAIPNLSGGYVIVSVR